MTALSWEKWIDRYTSTGLRVIARSWPGMMATSMSWSRSIRIEHLEIGEIVDYYDALVRDLDDPPIIVGHSFGGAFTEILLDRGLGAAGVAIDVAGLRGILSCLLAAQGWFSLSSRTHPTSTRPSP